MSFHQRSDIKVNQLREDIKNVDIFEKKLANLIKIEFDSIVNDILLLEPDPFINRIERGLYFSLENLYSDSCLSDQKLKSIVEKLIDQKKAEYSSIAQLLRNQWHTYVYSKKYILKREDILTNFRKHCINTSNIAKHNCGSLNANFILVKDKENNITFVICISCKKVYYSSFIYCHCDHCNIDFYTNLLNQDENSDYMIATWEKYHCPQIINEKMKCIQCNETFYINMKTGMLTCLNKNCNYTSLSDKITWTCNICQKEFKSKAIIYNPLQTKMVKNAIRQTLLLKHRAHPNYLPCCKLNVFFIEFFHKKICRGILYEGELNDKMIIVCDKCHAINYYERFIWTCPECLRKFQDINNANNIKFKHIKKNQKYQDLRNKKSKYNSVEKDFKKNHSKNEISSDNDSINIDNEILEEKSINNNYIMRDDKNLSNSNGLKLGINLLPRASRLIRKNPENVSSKIIQSDIEQDQTGNIKITINNESGKKINNFIINNNNISIYYSKHNNEKNNMPINILKHLHSEKFVTKFQIEQKAENKREENKNKNHHKVHVSKCLKRSSSVSMDSNIENKYKGNYLKINDNEVNRQEKKQKNIVSNNNINILKKRNYSIENIYHGREITSVKNQLKMIKVEYNPQKRRNRYSSVRNSQDSENKVIQSQNLNGESNKYIRNKLEKKPEINEKRNEKINCRKNGLRFHVNLDESNEKIKNEILKNEKDNKEKVNIRLKKFINMNYNKNENRQEKINESSRIIENSLSDKKNDKHEINVVSESKKESINNFEFKEDIIKKTIFEKEQKDYSLNSNNNNNFQFIQDNIGLQNLGGLSEKLLIHLKLRINNIFSKSKLPIFNIEDFKINHQIGEGTFGIIYSAFKTSEPNKEYALKKIIAKSITEVSSFLQEFELIYSCNHPNIMKIFGFCLRILDTTTFSIYVLMEKSKYDWEAEIKSHVSKNIYYTEGELINIMQQLSEALLFLKNKFKISHRDIKPQNVLVFEGDIYKLADFGEAKEIKINKKLNTLRGTELYMSPALYEGLKNKKMDIRHDSFKSDVFSLGFCFLYAAGLNFNLLFKVRDISDNDILVNIINTQLIKNYSKDFILLISLMLKIDEIKRFGFNEILEFINKYYK